MMSDIEANKNFSPIFTELYIRERKLNILFFLYHSFISKYL